MAKKPMAIRVESEFESRYKALSTVINVDNDVLLIEMIVAREKELTEAQRLAYDALLKAWGITV